MPPFSTAPLSPFSPSYYAPLLWTRSEQYSGGGNYRFAMYDATGNGRKLTSTALSAGVQNQGAGMDYYKYDAFGGPRGGWGSDHNIYKYGGAWGYITGPSGMLQLGARLYWPEIGRFVQQDTAKDGLNWYEYARSSPTNLLDPDGARLWDPDCAHRAKNSALAVTSNSGLEQHNGEGPGNAFLHCLWSCKMEKECGSFTAWAAGTGHEFWNHQGHTVPYANEAAGSAMDNHNNGVGRSLGNCSAQCADSCMKALKDGDLISHPDRRPSCSGGSISGGHGWSLGFGISGPPVVQSVVSAVSSGGSGTMNRRLRWLLLPIGVVVLGAGAFLAVLLLPWLGDHSPYDFGPLRGEPAAVPESRPDSTLEMPPFIVECYVRDSSSPVIATRRQDGSIVSAWALIPRQDDGQVVGEIHTCHLARAERTKDGYVIHGGVYWTHGEEHATFYFDVQGRLVSFYLSW